MVGPARVWYNHLPYGADDLARVVATRRQVSVGPCLVAVWHAARWQSFSSIGTRRRTTRMPASAHHCVPDTLIPSLFPDQVILRPRRSRVKHIFPATMIHRNLRSYFASSISMVSSSSAAAALRASAAQAPRIQPQGSSPPPPFSPAQATQLIRTTLLPSSSCLEGQASSILRERKAPCPPLTVPG